MPSLSPADRAMLLGPRGQCALCLSERIRHYCRSCDKFFETCICNLAGSPPHFEQSHRVYLWTRDGVVAIPNFDELLSDE